MFRFFLERGKGLEMKRILLVEDDPILRRCLKGALEREGYEVEESGSTKEAKRKWSALKFHLVVTDYKLGTGKNGLSLLVYLKKQGRSTPVILMSGWNAKWLGPVSKRLGADAFLEKPFPIGQFLEECARSIRGGKETPHLTFQDCPAQANEG